MLIIVCIMLMIVHNLQKRHLPKFDVYLNNLNIYLFIFYLLNSCLLKVLFELQSFLQLGSENFRFFYNLIMIEQFILHVFYLIIMDCLLVMIQFNIINKNFLNQYYFVSGLLFSYTYQLAKIHSNNTNLQVFMHKTLQDLIF